MGQALLLPDYDKNPQSLEGIHQSLEAIQKQLLFELRIKQEAIQLLAEKVIILEKLIDKKDQRISDLQSELGITKHLSEGNKQIVNKLLHDLDKLQQDVEWYKRTYENRSLFGTLKEKFINLI
ncbi:hypothetical protein ACMA1I_02975 [Pontibacter sp. 13R65]|uniref:hypothetical protein n=1 Tax=Pontibacter sp. 13R65 TaxID=3127458 RepID=UPI00301CF96B